VVSICCAANLQPFTVTISVGDDLECCSDLALFTQLSFQRDMFQNAGATGLAATHVEFYVSLELLLYLVNSSTLLNLTTLIPA